MSALIGTTQSGEEVCAWLDLRSSFSAALRARFLEAVSVSDRTLSTFRLSEAAKRCRNRAQCGIDPQGLADDGRGVQRLCEGRLRSAIPKGSTPYNRVQGDPRHTPNPCLAPIVEGPFYAVKLLPGSLGTFAGLSTDERARVLDRRRRRFAVSTRSATTRPA